MAVAVSQGSSTLSRALARVRRAMSPGVTHVVPLGLSCRVTHQARTCFGVGEAFPFDWWISPLAGVTRYLDHLDCERVYGAGGLEERVVDGRIESIRSVEFGFELLHEFPRTGEGASRGVAPGWQGHVAAARAQHERRLDRLCRLDQPGHRILFLRHKYGVVADEPAPAREIAELWDALHRLWRQADVALLLLNVGLDGPLPRGVLAVRFDDPPGPPPDEWRGDTPRWRAAFAARGLRLQRRSAARARSAPPPATGPPN
jgi:hypothetical protein